MQEVSDECGTRHVSIIFYNIIASYNSCLLGDIPETSFLGPLSSSVQSHIIECLVEM